jgi:betaine reductase
MVTMDERERQLRVVHYVNQFFGQIGGEDTADVGFSVKDGPVGPGIVLQKALGEQGQVVATVICGDNHFARDPEGAAKEGLALVARYEPDLFFAGPAFQAGRYGVACGAMCKAVGEALGIPTITGMFEENPGVDIYRRSAFICRTGDSARTMVEAMNRMVALGLRLLTPPAQSELVTGENIPFPEEYGYFPRLINRNVYTDTTVAERSVDKLLAKLRGEPFETEVQLPKFEQIPIPPAVQDVSRAEIALVSDGGLVPAGNPDGLSGRGNLRWALYELDTFLPERFDSSQYEVIHTGYYPVDVIADPNRMIPVDALREAVNDGRAGKLHNSFFSTSGNATVARRCAEMGVEMGAEMKKRGIEAAILTST